MEKISLRMHLFLSLCSKFKRIPQAAIIAAFAFTLKSLTAPPSAYAQIVQPTEANTICDLEPVIQSVLEMAVPLAGLALFVMLVIGGFSYLTSAGNPEAVKKAQGSITFAIAGIALLALAWVVLAFIETFTGVNVTNFQICPTPSP